MQHPELVRARNASHCSGSHSRPGGPQLPYVEGQNGDGPGIGSAPHSPGLRSADLHAKRLRAQATPCCIFAESHDRPSLGESSFIRPQIYPCIFVPFRFAAGDTIVGVL